jgi:hypothetical protein
MILVPAAAGKNSRSVMVPAFKKYLLSLLLWGIVFSACTNEKNQARKFNDSLIIYQVHLMEHLEKINELILSGKKDSLDIQLKRTHDWVKTSIPEVEAIVPYTGGEVMKEKVKDLLVFYDDLFTNDYPEYLQLLQSDTAAESRLKTVLMQIQFRELQAVQLERELEEAQDSFTQKFGIRMVKKEETK